jgi:RNA polymerase sigma-70 factor (ECF subfamily)
VSAADEEFDLFVRAHAASVKRYALSIVRDTWVADDVVQETFLRGWRFWGSFRGESPRIAWIFRICRNVAFDALKVKNARFAGEQPLTESVGSTLTNVFEFPAAEFSTSWVEEMSVLRQLTLQHREVIALIDLLGLDYATTAHVLDIPVGTVKSRLKRARESYREITKATDRAGWGA